MKIVLIMSVLVANSLFAGRAQGNLTYGQEIVENITAEGVITLDGTIVSDLLDVQGSLQAANCQITKLFILGSTLLDNCTIHQFSTVIGLFTARGSYFPQGLSICAPEIDLSACTIDSLHIPKESSSQEPQIVRLKNSTKIEKSLIFESGTGIVYIDSSCSIGKVVGGSVIND